ncbi:hypothetical protein DN730_09995 [Marinomonas piezotolerans]|uniref:Uncharacterized protein n=1 Tax=Marinomonas piezotolerans TaxID=2213058 RepID=A0A370UAA9_9GAMM|nr:hypothetical protein [Marinomonas piezotolerans]RDL44704.1 hypothetical protein DN730_09995 [Marinomonas piezotolerans]
MSATTFNFVKAGQKRGPHRMKGLSRRSASKVSPEKTGGVSARNESTRAYMPSDEAVRILAETSLKAYSKKPNSDYKDEDWSFV